MWAKDRCSPGLGEDGKKRAVAGVLSQNEEHAAARVQNQVAEWRW